MDGNFRVGSWFVEPSLNTISCNGTTVRLERKQVEVLVCLARNPGELVSKQTIMREVWHDPEPTSENVVEVYINYLRAKLEAHNGSRLIHTERGKGYVMENRVS